MYDYVTDKRFLSKMRGLCGDIMQDLCHELKKEFDIGATAFLVGSGKRKLILQNEKEPIDLDYNLEILRCENFNDCREIKESVRKAFNKVLTSYSWSDCQDSTSSLTTEQRCFNKGNPTAFSIDVCIVCTDNTGDYYRLIHQKTGRSYMDRYYWNKSPNSYNVKEKTDIIKQKGKWNILRAEYLNLKNYYLIRNDHNHPSFICYIEAVNNVYNFVIQRR